MHIYPHDRVLTNAAVKDMAQAHGLYLAQNFQLNAIEKAYPDLMTRSRVARLQFSAQFGQSITNMDALLSRAGPQEWERIKSETKSKIAPMLRAQPLTPQYAADFIQTVALRAKGEIPSPILEALLIFHPSYIARPHSEIIDGFKARFVADGSGKALGIKFHLDYPKSWSSADGNHAHVVRTFVSQNGRGFEMALVTIEALPPDAELFKLIANSFVIYR